MSSKYKVMIKEWREKDDGKGSHSLNGEISWYLVEQDSNGFWRPVNGCPCIKHYGLLPEERLNDKLLDLKLEKDLECEVAIRLDVDSNFSSMVNPEVLIRFTRESLDSDWSADIVGAEENLKVLVDQGIKTWYEHLEDSLNDFEELSDLKGSDDRDWETNQDFGIYH